MSTLILRSCGFDNPGLWAIFDELDVLKESGRLRVLRYGFESSVETWDRDQLKRMRGKLDEAFRALTKLEIALQVGLLRPQQYPHPSNWATIVRLFNTSGALLRYTNANLFFGVRFYAGRMALPEWICHPTEQNLRERYKDQEKNENQRVFALLPPPTILWPGGLDENTNKFLLEHDPGAGNESLNFLDAGYAEEPNASRLGTDREEPQRFEIWLRGLRPEAKSAEVARFERLCQGISRWALAKSDFYLALPTACPSDQYAAQRFRPLGGWVVKSPIAARCGLVDMYWIACILRADVSSDGSIVYGNASWLRLLAMHASLRKNTALESDLLKAEEVLRSVMGAVSELVRNASEITDQTQRRVLEPDLYATRKTATWRETHDDELRSITTQRQIRQLGEAHPEHCSTVEVRREGGVPLSSWSERLKSGSVPHDLIGLSISGGGIRSATFGLGVLQGLQELDLLRSVDYLSTVSGGGFIGSWLVANVARTKYWLGRLTSWDESISHLRRYSSYLSPITGVLSTDWWTMWAIWIRNTFLIQLTGLAWLLSLLLASLLSNALFQAAASPVNQFFGMPWPGWIVLLSGAIVVGSLWVNFRNVDRPATRHGWSSAVIRLRVVLPACIGSFFLAALIWGDAIGETPLGAAFQIDSYSDILKSAYCPWKVILIPVYLGLFGLGLVMFRPPSTKESRTWITPKNISLGALFSVLCTATLYLQLSGILRLFATWRDNPEQYEWYALVLGPSLILSAFTITVVFLIGLCGRYSEDGIREWWTKFGALLAIVAVLYLVITTAAIFGPLWVIQLLLHSGHAAIPWATVGSAIVSVVGGLFAGKSSRTDGQATQTKARALEVIARLGGFMFIVSSLLAASTLLFVVLQFAFTDDSLLTCSVYISDCNWKALADIHPLSRLFAFAITLSCGVLFSFFFDINVFGLSQFYTNRLVRCYLGGSRWAIGERRPQAFTAFDDDDNLLLGKLRGEFRGPFPIINCSLNLGGSSDLSVHTRHSASFTLTPLWCGSDRTKVGYARTGTRWRGYAAGVTLGQAAAVSGAAASPNMGYNTSPLAAFLLTMFNVRLGWWFPNPSQSSRNGKGLGSSFYYLFRELIGTADENGNFINVSDGGHFENLGIYELVHRRCRLIIAVDGECDENYAFGSLGNLVRICETDFGARIDIDISSIRPREGGPSASHAAVGKITYSNGTTGYLLYLKSSLTGDEDVGVAQYRSIHPTFPHETTADQFFSEDQFESYRRLGHHAVRRSLCGTHVGENPIAAVERLSSLLTPEGPTPATFVKHTTALDQVWERFRRSPQLRDFAAELEGAVNQPSRAYVSREEALAAGEVIQFMENVFLDLKLEDTWEHPDNRGWAILFTNWARSSCLRSVWDESRSTFGIRFEYFCASRLGLSRDQPPVRA